MSKHLTFSILFGLWASFVLAGCATASDVDEDAPMEAMPHKVNDVSFPVEAGSWGGKVRSGPGVSFEHIASLKEGDAVVLLERTDVVMNGYPWFRIKYETGYEGYKWGGILCATETWVEGVFERCAAQSQTTEKEQTSPLHNNTISYLELPLVDKEGTEAFYSKVFGWTFTEWGLDYIGFSGAGVEGGFNRDVKPASTGTGVLVVLYTVDLEQKLSDVEEAGGTIAELIFSFPGGKRFHFIDPNGTELAVWSEE